MKSELFGKDFRENDSTSRFVLQSKKMLRAHLDGDDRIIASAGSMVAYQGDVKFGYKGAGSIGNFLKKAVSGEDSPLMTVDGMGDVFFARDAKEIFTIKLEGESLTVNSHSLLAFDAGLKYDIKLVKSLAGTMAGGLFNIEISGHGDIAIVSDGTPVLLDCATQKTFVDPQAALCWSTELKPSFKNDLRWGSLIGRGSGESYQMAFDGRGFVVVQPSENRPAV